MDSVVEGDDILMSVGLLCLDIKVYLPSFPVEDEEKRVSSMKWARGGNSSNNCTVWSHLGQKCEYMGIISKSLQSRFLEEDLAKHGILFDNCVYHDNSDSPCAVALINENSGSRTILNSMMNLPELSIAEFSSKINFSKRKYRWIHFEGRRGSADEICKMLKYIDDYNKTVSANKRITTSVEIEKKLNQDVLADAADYVFIGKDHVFHKGLSSPEEAIEVFKQNIRPGAALIVPWGDKGAWARSSEGQVFHAPACSPTNVVDTLGAGDTFQAATILSLSKGHSLEEAVNYGCRVAGFKCGIRGFDGIRELKCKEI